MPHSHHSHSGQFCRHAAGTLEQVVLQAIEQGFETFGLTEHVPRYRTADLYPEEASMPLESLISQFDAFLDEAHRLKAKYADRINLLVGLETEHITSSDLDKLSELLETAGPRIEYLVGSVHHVHAIPIDFDYDTFTKSLSSFSSPSGTEKERMEAFLCSYFDSQYELMRRFHPEIIGHFDLCRLYNPTLQFSDYPDTQEKIRRNIRFAVSYGALFELNAAAFRKGWDAAYPGEDVVKIIMQEGGRFALSDDSHGPHAVGLNYSRLLEYGRRVGITEIWVLRSSQSPSAAGRRVTPQLLDGHWWEHRFWRGR
ncbi:Polymerase/histidinol phosphatase-like protein [Dichomitus squalens]|nr:Polymerase/histidinol phosphatase-like protein [Dichomitus squalens]TBU55158.1 Polymerase/histidinol phosphatase-like protein [Dichomitus squalens]